MRPLAGRSWCAFTSSITSCAISTRCSGMGSALNCSAVYGLMGGVRLLRLVELWVVDDSVKDSIREHTFANLNGDDLLSTITILHLLKSTIRFREGVVVYFCTTKHDVIRVEHGFVFVAVDVLHLDSWCSDVRCNDL